MISRIYTSINFTKEFKKNWVKCADRSENWMKLGKCYLRKSKQRFVLLFVLAFCIPTRMELDILLRSAYKHTRVCRQKKWDFNFRVTPTTVDSRFSRQLVYCLLLFYYNNTRAQKNKSIYSLQYTHTML